MFKQGKGSKQGPAYASSKTKNGETTITSGGGGGGGLAEGGTATGRKPLPAATGVGESSALASHVTSTEVHATPPVMEGGVGFTNY